MSLINPALSQHHKTGVGNEMYSSPDYICKLQDLAKRIPQLKETGDNFSLWERQLKVMLRNLTGTSGYFQQDLNQHDPKLNEAVFSLIFWSLDEALQQDFIVDGSAGDAFQLLADRFQSKSSARCLINRADFPEEILDNIVNMVHHQSFEEYECIKERKVERRTRTPKPGLKFEVYLGHHGAPVLTTFQNLAVVNRKFHRLCLPKLWQKISFPTSLPAPLSLWTDDLLLKHMTLVKSAQFTLEDIGRHPNFDRFSESERSLYDNTSSYMKITGQDLRYGIGLLNITKIFKVCPSIESVAMYLPPAGPREWSSGLTVRLLTPLRLLPQLRHLKLADYGFRGLSGDFVIDIIKETPSLLSLELSSFTFVRKPSEEELLGWNLAQLQKLRKLAFHHTTCEDQTWTSKSWPKQLTTLELVCCTGMTPHMAHNLISGNNPFLTKLHIQVNNGSGEAVNVRFDLPSLKHLRVDHYEALDLLVSFENCKSIEVLKYNGDIYEPQWDSMKNLISQHTWPKLSVLDFFYSTFLDGYLHPITAEETEERFKAFNIEVLWQHCQK